MKKSLIYGIICILLWSVMAPVIKVVVTGLPNLEALSLSSLVAFLFLLAYNAVKGKLPLLKTYRPCQLLTIAGLGAIGIFLYNVLYYYGLHELTVQEACIINYLWPIMTVTFSVLLLKERMTLPKAAAMLCSFAGVVILSLGGGLAGEGNRLAGMLCCFCAATLYGLFSVLNKKLDYEQNLSMMIFWLVSAVGSAALGLGTEEWIPLSGLQWAGIFWLGLTANAISYLLWALALKGVENTAVIANLAFLTPLLSMVFSAVFLKEEIRLRAVIALVFIVGGILLQNLWARRRERGA